MADLTSDQVQDAILNRPVGVAPEEVVQGLIDAGHRLLPKGVANLDNQTLTKAGVPTKLGGNFVSANGQPIPPTQSNPQADVSSDNGGNAQAVSPLGMIDDAQKLGRYDTDSLAAQAAKLGPLGGIVGVPALMAGSVIHPESTAELATTMGGGLALGGVKTLESALVDPTVKQSIAEALRINDAIPVRSTLQAINTPGLLSRAKTIDQANDAYGQAIPGLKSVVQSIQDQTGKLVPSMDDYQGMVKQGLDELGNIAQNGVQDAVQSGQKLLDGIQSANSVLRHKDFSGDKAILNSVEDAKYKLIDGMDQVFPGFKGVNNDLREAHVADDFNHWFPQNKNMSPNVLRGLLMGRNLGVGTMRLMSGDIVGGATDIGAGLSMSPKVAGAGIKAAQFLGQDVGGTSGASQLGALAPIVTNNASGPTKEALRSGESAAPEGASDLDQHLYGMVNTQNALRDAQDNQKMASNLVQQFTNSAKTAIDPAIKAQNTAKAMQFQKLADQHAQEVQDLSNQLQGHIDAVRGLHNAQNVGKNILDTGKTVNDVVGGDED